MDFNFIMPKPELRLEAHNSSVYTHGGTITIQSCSIYANDRLIEDIYTGFTYSPTIAEVSGNVYQQNIPVTVTCQKYGQTLTDTINVVVRNPIQSWAKATDPTTLSYTYNSSISIAGATAQYTRANNSSGTVAGNTFSPSTATSNTLTINYTQDSEYPSGVRTASFTYDITFIPDALSYDYNGNAVFTSEGNNNWHIKFTSGGTFTPKFDLTDIDIWGIGGGSGGRYTSNTNGGDGGGGGYTNYVQSKTLTSGTNYTVTIGAGGGSGSNGNASSFGSLMTASGGSGINGGSGGGGGGISGTRYGGSGGTNGGSGYGPNQQGTRGSGQGTTTYPFNNTASSMNDSSINRPFGGGGSGGAYGSHGANAPGNYGGGQGGYPNMYPGAGTANSGGGGGGGNSSSSSSRYGGAGGSGLIIIRNHR